MLYLFLESKNAKKANDWCKETFHDQGDTFVEMFENENGGKKYCMASIPDDNSKFANSIVKQFGCFKKDPRGNSDFKPKDEGDEKMKANFGASEKLKLKFIASEGKPSQK